MISYRLYKELTRHIIIIKMVLYLFGICLSEPLCAQVKRKASITKIFLDHADILRHSPM